MTLSKTSGPEKQSVNKARQYKPSTVRRLDILSANQCAFPNCEKKIDS